MEAELDLPPGAPVDLQIVADFFNDYGSSAPELIRVFLDDTEQRLQRMSDLAARQRRAELALDAHSLKSSALAFGMTALAALAARMQYELDEAWTDTAPAQAAQLCRAFENGAPQLRDYAAKLQAR